MFLEQTNDALLSGFTDQNKFEENRNMHTSGSDYLTEKGEERK